MYYHYKRLIFLNQPLIHNSEPWYLLCEQEIHGELYQILNLATKTSDLDESSRTSRKCVIFVFWHRPVVRRAPAVQAAGEQRTARNVQRLTINSQVYS